LSEVRKYATFAKSLKKHPDRVIFSTFNNDWSVAVKNEINKISKAETLFNKDMLAKP
jgi:hypothetical protein